jgi:hypothetical protein
VLLGGFYDRFTFGSSGRWLAFMLYRQFTNTMNQNRAMVAAAAACGGVAVGIALSR